MTFVETMKNQIMNSEQITMPNALLLYREPLEELCTAANELRKHFCGEDFDICTIINGKSGKCSEDCKFCAQSSYHNTCIEEYLLLPTEKLVEQAKHNCEQGVLRYSIVTSGKRLSDPEVDKACSAIRRIRTETEISVCVSFGLLNEIQYKKLKNAGATRVHNNLETSRRNFPSICTTHSYTDKINAIKAAQAAGFIVCSGGIMGLPNETAEDRVSMAFTLRELGIKSVPINILKPISGTPLEGNKKLSNADMRRIVAVYRFILPTASIRLAGGRGFLDDKGATCFLSGANAAISGDMLTTAGITVETDMQLIKRLGYRKGLCNE